MPTNAGGTGTIASRGLGDLVTELASSWNSHGGGRCFVRTIHKFRQRVLFVREIDPYDGRMPDSRRVVSVIAYGTAGGTHSGTGPPTNPPGTADGGSPPAGIDICDGPDRLQTEFSEITATMSGGSPPADGNICNSPDTLQTEWSATSTEMAGGSPPAYIDICESPDALQTEWSATYTEMAGGSPPADRDICACPDTLQTEWSAMSSEMAGGSPPADIDICDDPERLQTVLSVITTTMPGESPPAEIRNSRGPDRLQKEISVMSAEKAGGDLPTDTDNGESPELLQRVGSVTVVVSEKWMERFVIKQKVMCLDDSASDDDPAGWSSDSSSVVSVQNQIPTVVCVQTVVSEKWMDRFVFGLVECLSVSRTRSIPLLFLLGGGGAVADAYPLVVVESDTGQVSGLQLVESDAAQVSVLPVAGCKFQAVSLGKVAFDLVGLGDGPPCLRDFADFDRRTSPVGSCSPGRNPGG